ncbi:DUF5819 family protein [Arthrobacter echini]|uniref:DUF5819 family protein n=1 Tax=Arthrobacter echini TaxID=1529066 RepID=UPI0016523564|nr:DUF5819 family protein [Arthrobacter echini]
MKNYLRYVLAALALTGVCVYACLTLIVTGPANPIKVAAAPTITSLYSPYFLQNWQLFAPDPLAQERGILAQMRCADGAETEFQDLTTQLVTELQSTRLFSSREHRIITNAIARRFETDEVVQKLIDKDTAIEQRESVDQYAEELNDRNVRASETLLAEYATRKLDTSACEGVFDAVRVRYVFHDYPGWSERQDWTTQGEITTIDSEWVNAD